MRIITANELNPARLEHRKDGNRTQEPIKLSDDEYGTGPLRVSNGFSKPRALVQIVLLAGFYFRVGRDEITVLRRDVSGDRGLLALKPVRACAASKCGNNNFISKVGDFKKTMAITIDARSDETVALDEYLEYMNREVDVKDIDQVLDTAPMFASLLNDRTMIVNSLNKELRQWREFQNRNHYSAQTFLLGTSKKFVVRANVWMPPSKDSSMAAWEDKFYYYRVPHDHNFSFMTGGYHGSGYETVIYEYDYEGVVGVDREQVPLRFLERTTLPKGKIMFYRASKDIHSQEHPREFSISVNLLV